MKASRLSYLMAIAVALTFVATGCKHKPAHVTQLPGYQPTRVGQPQNPLPPTQPFNPNEEVKRNEAELPADLTDLDRFNQNREQLAAQTVHFDFDSAAVKSSERSKVDAVATFMKGAPGNVALLIEGHCDERGTEEYNRSLGERRALALREALMAAGADGQRITTRSYGEDRPAVQGHDESAYRQNRRGVFVVLTPK